MLTASTNVVMTPCAGRDSAGLTTMTPLNTSPVVRGFGRFVAPIANLQIALVDGFLAAGTTWSRRKETWVRRNGSFPYGNASIPHRKIGYRRTQFILHVVAGGHFDVEMPPFHIEMTSSHAGMTRSHIGICPRRLSTSGSYFGPARSDTGTTETHMAARQAQ